ncbi:BTAD domain-containing putative transcriptional regulator [Meiothermus sp. Pnk-1]|uniref:ATP-binding protein n=3 Tax=unclassified Meiothermus TaxID=370471 RepID=UPI0011B6B896|nr:BTAD domain-containing putative transcriptional regulator [Meiothermus sp. Pnk-1]
MSLSPGQLLLLGSPELWIQGERRTLPTRKLWGLLAYLALEGPKEREHLAALFWEGEGGRANLRRELVRMRKSGLALASQGSQLGLPQLQVDVEAFLGLCAARRFAEALPLWRGEFLEGLVLAESPLFAEWLELVRLQLSERYEEALLGRALELEEAGAYAEALGPLEALLRRNPFREEAQEAALRLYAKNRQPGRALAHFQGYAASLRQEVGLEPPRSLQALAEAIARGDPLPSPTPPNPALDHPPLVEREAPWNALTKTPAPLVLLLGEAGVGKSRLAWEFVRTQRGFRYLLQEPQDSEVAYGGLSASLRRLWEEGERFPGLDQRWLLEAARLVPELAPTPPPRYPGPEAQAALATFREGLCRTLLHGLPPGGWLLWEDLHYADRASLDFLPYLVRRAAALGLRVLVTARPEAYRPDTYLYGALSGLEREGRVARIALENLSEPGVWELVRRLSGMAQGGRLFARRLHRATGGNPLFLLKTLQHLFQEGLLWADEKGWHTPYDEETADYRELPLPQSVQEQVCQRLKRLGATGVAEVLAVSGRPLDLQGLKALLGGDLLGLAALLDQLEAAGLLQATREGYRFRHDLFRQAVLKALSPVRRQALHGLLADHAPLPAEEALLHLEAAGRYAEAWPLAAQAAQEALVRQAFAQAEALWRRALEAFQRAPGSKEEEARLLLGWEQALMVLSRLPEQASVLERLQALAPGLSPLQQAEVGFRRVRFLAMQGRWAEALTLAEDVLAIHDHPHTRLYRADALANLGRAGGREEALSVWNEAKEWGLRAETAYLLAKLAVLGEDEEALAEWLDHLAQLGSSGLAEVRLQQFVCAQALGQGDLQRVISSACEALSKAEALGYRDALGVFQNFLGMALARLGRPAEALAAYRTARGHFAELGRAHFLAGVGINLAGLLLRLGAFAEVERTAEEALATFQAIGEPRGSAEALLVLGQAALWQGRPAEAEARFRQGQGLAEGAGLAQSALEATADLAVSLFFQGRYPEAEALLQRVLGARKTPGPSEAAWLALTLLRQGRLEEACVWAERAYSGREGYTGFLPELLLLTPLAVRRARGEGEEALYEELSALRAAQLAAAPPEYREDLRAFHQRQDGLLA